MTNAPSQDQIDRAWRYLDQSATILHERGNALLVCQSFLVIAYLQALLSEQFKANPVYPTAAAAVLLLGFLVTMALKNASDKIRNGGDVLKATYLVHDPVYSAYLEKVRENPGHRLWASMTNTVPGLFIGFWILAAIHLALLLAGVL